MLHKKDLATLDRRCPHTASHVIGRQFCTEAWIFSPCSEERLLRTPRVPSSTSYDEKQWGAIRTAVSQKHGRRHTHLRSCEPRNAPAECLGLRMPLRSIC